MKLKVNQQDYIKTFSSSDSGSDESSNSSAYINSSGSSHSSTISKSSNSRRGMLRKILS